MKEFTLNNYVACMCIPFIHAFLGSKGLEWVFSWKTYLYCCLEALGAISNLFQRRKKPSRRTISRLIDFIAYIQILETCLGNEAEGSCWEITVGIHREILIRTRSINLVCYTLFWKIYFNIYTLSFKYYIIECYIIQYSSCACANKNTAFETFSKHVDLLSRLSC